MADALDFLNDEQIAALHNLHEHFIRESSELVAALSEGFCPWCKGRVQPDREFKGFCPSCDLFWNYRPAESGGFSWNAATGFFVRDQRGRSRSARLSVSKETQQ